MRIEDYLEREYYTSDVTEVEKILDEVCRRLIALERKIKRMEPDE